MENTLTLASVEESRNTLTVSCQDIVSASNKVTGQRYVYAGTETPKQMKERLMAVNPDLTSTKANKMIREIMKGNKSLAWAEQDLLNRHLESLGAIPVTTEVRKGTAVTRFVIPAKDKPKKDSPESILLQAAHKLCEVTGWTLDDALAALK